jgi:hypothetical protein
VLLPRSSNCRILGFKNLKPKIRQFENPSIRQLQSTISI